MSTWIDLTLSALILPIALRAAEGFDEIRELKTKLDLMDILLTLSLDSFLACLNNSSASLLWKGSAWAKRLALLRDFLIWANSWDLGGFLGGGGIWAGELNLEAWESSKLIVDTKKASKASMQEVGDQLSSMLLRMGVTEF